MLSGKKFTASELKGIRSVRVMQITSMLMLGLLMLPINMNKKFDDFYTEILEYDESAQRKVLEDAIRFVELKDEELLAVMGFCKDANGLQIDKTNISNYNPAEIMDMVVEVCLQVFKIDVFFCQKTASIKSPITA